MGEYKEFFVRTWGHRLVDGLIDHVFPLFQAVSSIFLIIINKPLLGNYIVRDKKSNGIMWDTFWGCFYNDLFFWLAALIFILSSIAIFYRNQRVVKLEKQIAIMKDAIRNSYSDFKQAWDIKLKTFIDNYDLSHKERISIYLKEGDKFVLYHRYSDDPDLKKPGRPFYPADEGCIGQAYRSGRCEKEDLPCPQQDITAYKRIQKNDFNLSAGTIDNFKMLSRSYAAYAIYDDPHKRNKIAVIVFESLDAQRFSGLKLYDRINNSEGINLTIFINIWKNMQPSLNYAKEMGF